MLRIIIDSTADIPKAFVEQNGILVLPLHVLIERTGGGHYGGAGSHE